MLPSHQGLHPDDLAGSQVHHRLIVHPELLTLQGPSEVILQPQTLSGFVLHARVEDPVARLAIILGPVHGEVSFAQQMLGRVLAGVANGDPDAWGDDHWLAADSEGCLKHLYNTLRNVRWLARVLDVLNQYGELVPAEACDGILGPQARLHAVRNRDEQPIPRLVS